MKFSVGIPPGPHAVDVALKAEELGFDGVWLFDSPAIYEDIWITVAQIAERTTRIELGTSVLVPSLRHPMTTAAAIATIERLAPGRLTCGWGTGMTARFTMGQSALTWDYMREYLEQLRGLLRGETVQIEGKSCKMMHRPSLTAARPINTPFIISAFGPKGIAITQEIGDGWIGSMDPPVPFDRAVKMQPGTVLEEGESPYSDRVLNSAGVWQVGMWHSMYEWNPEGLLEVPGGQAFADAINAHPEELRRHAIHDGHMTHLNEADRAAYASIDYKPDWQVWVGTPDEILTKAQESADNGVTDLLFTPAGDYLSEIERFYNAVMPLQS